MKLQCVRASWWERSRREAKVMLQPRDKGKVPGANSHKGERRGLSQPARPARCLALTGEKAHVAVGGAGEDLPRSFHCRSVRNKIVP